MYCKLLSTRKEGGWLDTKVYYINARGHSLVLYKLHQSDERESHIRPSGSSHRNGGKLSLKRRKWVSRNSGQDSARSVTPGFPVCHARKPFERFESFSIRTKTEGSWKIKWPNLPKGSWKSAGSQPRINIANQSLISEVYQAVMV